MLQLENVICSLWMGEGMLGAPLVCQVPPAPPGLFEFCNELNVVVNSILMHGNVTVGKCYLSLPMGEGRLGAPLLFVTFPLEKVHFNCTFLFKHFHWKKGPKLFISVKLVFFHWKILKFTFSTGKKGPKTVKFCSTCIFPLEKAQIHISTGKKDQKS